MGIDLEFEGSLTERHQTTVPSGVRQALKVGARDRVVWRVIDSQSAIVTFRHDTPEHGDDPALSTFLNLLERDIAKGNLTSMNPEMLSQMECLSSGVGFDLDAPLPPDDADE